MTEEQNIQLRKIRDQLQSELEVSRAKHKHRLRWEVPIWCLGALWVVLFLWPAEWWQSPDVLLVSDGQIEDLEITFVGGPLRGFDGSYSVTIVDADTLGTPEGAEMRSGIRPYNPGAERPDPITLTWWAWGMNQEGIVPGRYIMETCWIVHRPFFGIVPNKHVCITSNVFTVNPDEDKDGEEGTIDADE